jgi:hypothetical protein
MAAFSGNYERQASAGSVQNGSCRVTFDEENLRIASSRTPDLAFDLGDIAAVSAGDYQLQLKLYDGSAIVLSQFGRMFEQLRHDLVDAWRGRLVVCLLLEDLEEVTHLDGFAQLDSAERSFSSPAEIRLYRSNLAILPTSAVAFQWRLADIDAVDFDETTYTLGLRSGVDRLILTRMGKRTRDLIARLQEAMTVLSDRSAQALHSLFPFLSPEEFASVAGFMKEGRTVSLAQLATIHPAIERALLENAVGASRKPFFNELKKRAADPGLYAGFKLVRTEQDEPSPEEPENSDAAAAPEPLPQIGDESVLCWFFFPLGGGPAHAEQVQSVAWECTSLSGRATYIFRADGRNPDASIHRLNRGIVTLNFRREPIYLPDNALDVQPRFRRYAIARRNIPVLKELRGSFIGRALHTSAEAWQKQLDELANTVVSSP